MLPKNTIVSHNALSLVLFLLGLLYESTDRCTSLLSVQFHVKKKESR